MDEQQKASEQETNARCPVLAATSEGTTAAPPPGKPQSAGSATRSANPAAVDSDSTGSAEEPDRKGQPAGEADAVHPPDAASTVCSPARLGRSRRALTADIAVLVALAVLIGFGPAGFLLAGRLALAPAPLVPAAEPTALDRPDTGLRNLPAGLPPRVRANAPADLRGLADGALGPAGGHILLSLLGSRTVSLRETAVGARLGFTPYPYRYPALTSILDAAPGGGRTPAARALGAALLVLAGRPGQHQQSTTEEFPNAAPAAFAVLDRAREAGDCAAQLDLLLLLSADDHPRDGPVRTEATRAERACPSDPTPDWLLVQYLSQRMLIGPPSADEWRPVVRDAEPSAEIHQASRPSRRRRWAISSASSVLLTPGMPNNATSRGAASAPSRAASAASISDARPVKARLREGSRQGVAPSQGPVGPGPTSRTTRGWPSGSRSRSDAGSPTARNCRRRTGPSNRYGCTG